VTVTTLLVAVLAWVAFAQVSAQVDSTGPSFVLLAADSFLAALFIGGLEGLLFGLVPLRFLPGARIKGWSWLAWAALMAVVLYAFVHVLLIPESGYLGRSTAASATVTVVLFAAFGLLSCAFWLYFRLRPEAPQTDERPGAGVVEAPAPAPQDAVPPAGQLS
jgi:hypothetical protein